MTAPTNPAALSGMYYNQHWPLALVTLLQDLIANQQASPNAPQNPMLPVVRVWFSQPRPSSDPTGEVLTTNFKLPLSIGEFSIEILRVACTFEVWYQDRNNNWIAMPDENFQPMKISLSTSQDVDWFKYHVFTYPVVAKAVQFRITRRLDPALGNQPTQIGLRQGLIRRNVYNRSSGTQAMEDEQDSLGNVISKYIQDWDAAGAIDDDPFTFWRSAPQPDPNAVVCLYQNFSQPDGSPEPLDGIVIDPVYINQNLNLYYSNDDTVGTLKLSPIALPPDTDLNTAWVAGSGRVDVSGPGGPCIYQFPLALGPLINRDAWVGIEWKPDFTPIKSNAVQFVSISGNVTSGTFKLGLNPANLATGLAPNISSAALQTALENLDEIGIGNVHVTVTSPGTWSVEFINDLAEQDIPELTFDASGLVGISIVMDVSTTTVGGEGGGPALNPVLLSVTPGMDAVQIIEIDGVSSGGHFQLSADDGDHYTANLSNTADGPALQTALEALTAIGTDNVLVVGDAGGPWSVTFRNDLGQQAVPNLTALSALTGSPIPVVKVRTVTTGAPPPNPGGDQYWPEIHYDVGAQEIVLELSNGVTAQSYSVPLSPSLIQGAPLRIVAGWGYNPDTVFLSVARADGTQLGTLTTHPTSPALPSQITFDGEVGYLNFRGTMTATVIKLENWSAGQAAFQANPTMYVNPNPVQPDPNSGLVPSTTLDNAVFAADWTLQDMGCGGGHASVYESKVWTPIFANYVTQKGKFAFPQRLLLKYLKLEFTNLTEESYPVYDSGIQTMYNLFPVAVTQQSANPDSPLAAVGGLLSRGGIPVAGGSGSVNWLNSASITNATNSIFGNTVNPIAVQSGPGTATTSLPNTVGSTAADTSVEAASPWVYRRQLLNTNVLASQQLKNIEDLPPGFTPSVTFSPTPVSLPMQGSDVWLVPGQTAAIPANVMTGLTGSSQVVVDRKGSTANRLRFTAIGVHQYQTKAVVRDAAIAYFAGVRDVTGYRNSYITGQDPPKFVFSPFDPTQWVFNNVLQLDSGPISTQGITYQVQNPMFDVNLDHWVAAQGEWSVDPGMGRYQYGAATVVADGHTKILLSEDITAWPQVTPGAHFRVTIAVQWQGVTSTGQPAVLTANYYNGEEFLSQQTSSIAATGTDMWADDAQQGAVITLNATVPANTNRILLGAEVGPTATAGQFWWDTVLIDSTDDVEATTFIDLITQSTFVKVDCKFNDSGLVRSDSMWADIDPANTNISPTQLAWYTSTIPDQIPSGTWGDSLAKWRDTTITWGERFSSVAINVDPNMIFDGKRFLHFSRAAGAEQAGLKVRQVTNFVAGGLFRLCVVFYKPEGTANQITLRLRRVSDGVYLYEESFTPQDLPGGIGSTYLYRSAFQELPDSPDQVYTLEMVLFGDAADEIYVNDLYAEVAQIRYFMRLGGSGAFLHDVTELAYSDHAIVSATLPVSEVSVQSTILSPTAWQYSAVLTPNYLK